MELDFISAIGKLKDIERTGWLTWKVKNPESVADHSFRVAIMAMIFAPQLNLDTNKCIKMALTHDLPEVYAGDIASRPKEEMQDVDNTQKMQLEQQAAEKLFSSQPELHKLWQEYEDQSSQEAILVKDLDQVEMVLQALEYQKSNRTDQNLDEFFECSKPKIKTDFGKQLWNHIHQEFLKNKIN